MTKTSIYYPNRALKSYLQAVQQPQEDQEDGSCTKDLLDFFTCPITQELLRDPVIDHEGNTYERSAIVEWIHEHGVSPITRNPMAVQQLHDNTTLFEVLIQETLLLQQEGKVGNEELRDFLEGALSTRRTANVEGSKKAPTTKVGLRLEDGDGRALMINNIREESNEYISALLTKVRAMMIKSIREESKEYITALLTKVPGMQLGMTLSEVEDKLVVTMIKEGGLAAASALGVGMVLYSINGEPVAGKSSMEAAGMLTKAQGTLTVVAIADKAPEGESNQYSNAAVAAGCRPLPRRLLVINSMNWGLSCPREVVALLALRAYNIMLAVALHVPPASMRITAQRSQKKCCRKCHTTTAGHPNTRPTI
ncbi:U-box domain-containing protein [Seminavis robusta]|uniref:U-box domain-containing protein n=1 Tax=Seminavis robusta TaxID=568900 RepID=A0A9N8EGI5_9STRA|nr:U-box domain-containing protein [Seminavis robusta]|eukprot:Sro1127_g244240.1 U-box domain-containing protein (366) ;mRNA; r:32873-33970